jgi:hypothetical protein
MPTCASCGFPGTRKFYYYGKAKIINFFPAVVAVAAGKVETRSGTMLRAGMIAAPVLENWSAQK